jgi:hypothetical protein
MRAPINQGFRTSAPSRTGCAASRASPM